MRVLIALWKALTFVAEGVDYLLLPLRLLVLVRRASRLHGEGLHLAAAGTYFLAAHEAARMAHSCLESQKAVGPGRWRDRLQQAAAAYSDRFEGCYAMGHHCLEALTLKVAEIDRLQQMNAGRSEP